MVPHLTPYSAFVAKVSGLLFTLLHVRLLLVLVTLPSIPFIGALRGSGNAGGSRSDPPTNQKLGKWVLKRRCAGLSDSTRHSLPLLVSPTLEGGACLFGEEALVTLVIGSVKEYHQIDIEVEE
jgi:hypothetical protein